MNVSRLRAVDSWLGIPAALMLGLAPRRRRPPPERPSRVVFVKLFGLGSIIAFSGAVRQFRDRLPGARLVLVTFAEQAGIGALLGEFDEVLAVRTDGVAALVRDVWTAVRRLRRLRPDMAVDVEYFSKLSTVFCACIGARYRLGFLLPARWRRRLVDGGIAFREDIHFSECVARLLAPWGVDYRAGHAPAIHADGASRERAAALLRDGSPTPFGVRWVLINANAHEMCPERRWPPARFAALVETLAAADPNLRFALLGALRERPAAEALLAQVGDGARPRCRNLAGRTDLATAAGLLAQAALLVTNDSGLMHLAAAVGTPLVALFGPESPVRYGPLAGNGTARVLQGEVACGPCLTYMNRKRAPCRGANRCMESIPVDAVAAACRDRLGEPRRAARA